MRAQRSVPTHAALIAETTVTDDTAGVVLTPVCIWAAKADNGDQFSVWFWLSGGQVDAVCMISNIVKEGVPKLLMEISRMAYDALTVVAKEQTVTFPGINTLPAIGYMAFLWDIT